jgi:hypothetical protein
VLLHNCFIVLRYAIRSFSSLSQSCWTACWCTDLKLKCSLCLSVCYLSTEERMIQRGPRVPARGRILGRNWDKSLNRFPPSYSQSPLLTDFTPPPPPRDKSVWIWFLWTETSSLRTLKIMPRNLNEIVCSWIPLQARQITTVCTNVVVPRLRHAFTRIFALRFFAL